MTHQEKLDWAKGRSLDEILAARNKHQIKSHEWQEWNKVKASHLESIKPSTDEEIIYFDKKDLKDISLGLTLMDEFPAIKPYIGKRSELEYNPLYRHPIPYVIVKYQNNYFFSLREKGGGEMRLEGKKGLLGGHVGKEDYNANDLANSILNGMKRELSEEVGITDDIIKTINFKGLLKLNGGVESDHLGIIYEVELTTDNITSQELDKVSGIWINKNDLAKHAEQFETWANLIYQELLK